MSVERPSGNADKVAIQTRLASAGKRVGFAGDSIPAAGYGAAAPIYSLRNYGHMPWLRFLSRQRIYIDTLTYLAVMPGVTAGSLAGTDTLTPDATNAAIAATSYTALLATDVDWIDLTVGTNNVIASPTTLAKFKTDYGLLVSRAVAAGKRIMLTPILPRTYSMTSAARRLQGQFNDYIFSLHDPSAGVYVTDPTPYWLDYAGGATGSLANKTYDGLHPSADGGYWLAKPKADLLNQLLAPRERLFDNADNVWNADNLTGNLLANGMLSGTGGTLANSATGNVPTSWTGTRGSSGQAMTVAFSKVAHATLSGLEWAAMTLGGTSTTDGLSLGVLRQDYSLSGTPLAAGDVVEALCDVEVTGQSNLQGFQMMSRLIGGTNNDTWDMRASGQASGNSSLVVPEGITISGVMRTPRQTVPTSLSAGRFELTVMGGANASAVAGLIKFGRPYLKKIV